MRPEATGFYERTAEYVTVLLGAPWQVIGPALTRVLAGVDLAPPQEPAHVPATPMGEVTVGRHRYTGTARAEPAGDDAVTWEMSYQVHDGDRLVAELTARQHWHVLTRDQLAAEVAAHDLTVDDPTDAGLHVIRKPRR